MARLNMKFVLAAMILCTLAPRAHAEDRVDASQITESVVKEISGEVPASHVPAIREFAKETTAELKNISNFNKKTHDIIVQSILRRVRKIHKHKTMSSKQLQKRLQRILTSFRKNLNTITPEMLDRDWVALKKQHQNDTEKVQKIVGDFFQSHSVVIIDTVLITREFKKEKKEVRSEKWVKVNQKKFVASVTQQIKIAGKRSENYLGDIFVMPLIKYQIPLDKTKAADIRKFLEQYFLVDNTIIISSSTGGIAYNIHNWLLGRKFPEHRSQKKMFQQFKSDFERLELWNHKRKPAKDLIITFGGKVDSDILDGTKFGFISSIPRRKDGTYLTPREHLRIAQKRFQIKQKFERSYRKWVHGISRQVRSTRQAKETTGHIHVSLKLNMIDSLSKKLLSLKEFYGQKEVDQVTFSPIEKRFLNLLRVAVTNAPLFVESQIPVRFQSYYYDEFISPTVGKVSIPGHQYDPKLQKEWDVVDRKPYDLLIKLIQGQLDKESSKPKYNAAKAQCKLRMKAFIAMRISRRWEQSLNSEVEKKVTPLLWNGLGTREDRICSHFLKRYTPNIIGPCTGKLGNEVLTEWEPAMLEYLIYCYENKVHVFAKKNDKLSSQELINQPFSRYFKSGNVNVDAKELKLRQKVFAALEKLYVHGISTPALKAIPEKSPK